MRSAYYVRGRFYGTMYSLLLVHIHYYVMSLNTKYVVRNCLTTAFSQYAPQKKIKYSMLYLDSIYLIWLVNII